MNVSSPALQRSMFVLLLALSAVGGALATDLPAAQNLRTDAEKAAQAGGPLIVVYSRKDCKYCETVKRDYLKPLADNPRYRDKLVVRQINQDSDAQLVDFRGEATTHARFTASEKIKLVPVVAFYGPQGKQLAEPIVGTRLPDFYPGYLEDAVEKSAQAIKAH